MANKISQEEGLKQTVGRVANEGERQIHPQRSVNRNQRIIRPDQRELNLTEDQSEMRGMSGTNKTVRMESEKRNGRDGREREKDQRENARMEVMRERVCKDAREKGSENEEKDVICIEVVPGEEIGVGAKAKTPRTLRNNSSSADPKARNVFEQGVYNQEERKQQETMKTMEELKELIREGKQLTKEDYKTLMKRWEEQEDRNTNNQIRSERDDRERRMRVEEREEGRNEKTIQEVLEREERRTNALEDDVTKDRICMMSGWTMDERGNQKERMNELSEIKSCVRECSREGSEWKTGANEKEEEQQRKESEVQIVNRDGPVHSMHEPERMKDQYDRDAMLNECMETVWHESKAHDDLYATGPQKMIVEVEEAFVERPEELNNQNWKVQCEDASAALGGRARSDTSPRRPSMLARQAAIAAGVPQSVGHATKTLEKNNNNDKETVATSYDTDRGKGGERGGEATQNLANLTDELGPRTNKKSEKEESDKKNGNKKENRRNKEGKEGGPKVGGEVDESDNEPSEEEGGKEEEESSGGNQDSEKKKAETTKTDNSLKKVDSDGKRNTQPTCREQEKGIRPTNASRLSYGQKTKGNMTSAATGAMGGGGGGGIGGGGTGIGGGGGVKRIKTLGEGGGTKTDDRKSGGAIPTSRSLSRRSCVTNTDQPTIIKHLTGKTSGGLLDSNKTDNKKKGLQGQNKEGTRGGLRSQNTTKNNPTE